MLRKGLFPSVVLVVCLLAACGGGGSSSNPVGVEQGPTPTPTPTPAFIGGVGNVSPGDFTVELEMIYTLIVTQGSEEAVTYTATILLEPEITADNLNASGEGDILEDVPFQIEEVTIHNVADWIIEVDATYDPNLGDEPLLFDFVFNGRGYAGPGDVQIGAHMDAGGTTYTHQLTMPLVNGASKSFDIEGWKDYLEWTVVMHLK